jgi:hypothetical protein
MGNACETCLGIKRALTLVLFFVLKTLRGGINMRRKCKKGKCHMFPNSSQAGLLQELIKSSIKKEGPELPEDFVECPLEEPKGPIKFWTKIGKCEKHIGGAD